MRSSRASVVQSTIFEGHFPGYPILPGVLMIESMAQTGGNLVLVLENFLGFRYRYVHATVEVSKQAADLLEFLSTPK